MFRRIETDTYPTRYAAIDASADADPNVWAIFAPVAGRYRACLPDAPLTGRVSDLNYAAEVAVFCGDHAYAEIRGLPEGATRPKRLLWGTDHPNELYRVECHANAAVVSFWTDTIEDGIRRAEAWIREKYDA